MKGRPFKQSTQSAFPPMVTNPEVEEALAKQAAARTPKAPPKQMPITPTLPRVPKPHRKRRPR